MSSVRTRICLVGGTLAAAAGLLAAKGSVLGADLPRQALLGVALGAVLGLVPGLSVLSRLASFLVGFGAAWLGYALRAGFLPDSGAGRAVAAVTVVLVVTAAAAASAGKLPLWAGLLGGGTLVGAYETTFAANPGDFVSGSVTAITTVLVSSALGLLVASTVEELLVPQDTERPARGRPEVALPAPRESVDADARQEAER